MADLSPRVAECADGVKLSGMEAQIRQLIQDLAAKDPPAAKQGLDHPDSVILDVEVDGVRCLLLRVLEAPAPLSPRELEIARMVAKGYPNKTIASILEISSWTVASHLRRVFSKLGVSSRAAMVARLLDDAAMKDARHGTESKVSVDELRRERTPLPTQLAT
jgi:DNA-binding CsgD family transcriptional regulator